MNIKIQINRYLCALLISSAIINVVLGVTFLNKEPFDHQISEIHEFYINGIAPPEYDIPTYNTFTKIEHPQDAMYFAQEKLQETFGDRRTNSFKPVNGEHFYMYYFPKLDCWAVTSDQTVGALKWSPCALFDSEGQNVVAFLSPFEMVH